MSNVNAATGMEPLPDMPAPTLELPTVLDNTILSAFRGCQTKSKYEYMLKLAGRTDNIHLHAGKCFATALESVYNNVYFKKMDKATALNHASVEFNHEWGDFEVFGPTPKTKERMWAAVEYYMEVFDPPNDYITPWPGVPKPFEFSFAVPMDEEFFGYDFPVHPVTGDPFTYAGRFDMIGDHMGQIRIRDDKTTSALGPTWHKQFVLRSQFLGYVACMRLLGYDVDTVEVRGVCILKNDIKIQPSVHTYTTAQLEKWKYQTFKDVTNLVKAFTSNDFDHNFANECTAYGGCQFLDLCRADNDADYFHTYARRDWNPLAPTT